MIFYNLMTLNAAAMLDHTIVCQRDEIHNYRPEFRYDFNEKSIKNLILSSTERHADNALFYQVIASKYGEDSIGQYRMQEDCISRSLIYVDFSGIFSPQAIKENKRKSAGYSIDKWDKKSIDAKCAPLFEDGFSIVFEDGEVKTYIPFDKSGNMSRHYAITFVDKELFPEIDQRLRLGIDFSSIHVVLSKYYAYRGLYLTDGVRVDQDSEHVLDQNTVLVIDDDTHDYMQHGEVQNVPVITADKELLQKGKFVCVEKAHPFRLNSFDGEGLISPFFAEYLNVMRRQAVYMKRDGVSFQIRMPFIKGMLHEVDFHRFFREQLSEEDYYIKDIFGIPRRMKNVQIILTRSMFKCAGWLKDYCKIHTEIKDPMAWFFKMFDDYNHALYVCNSDSNMGNLKVSLNYQFINTMELDSRSLEKLIKRHLEESHSISKTGSKYTIDVTEYMAEALFEDEDTSFSVPAWRFALDLNPDFVKDPYVRSMLKMDELSRVKDICRGKIIVDGVLKYLSGDLLALLIHMIYNKKSKNEEGIGTENGLGVITEDGFQINKEVNVAVITRLRTQLIRTGKFYTSDHDRIGLKTNTRYGILRNPHLSRNEQCSLRPYIPETDDEKNVYNRYFSHLSNIIMLPYESIDAMTLGGADYDGDKVKIILDRNINSAILKGSYVRKRKEYVRKLPVVEIPGLANKKEPVPDLIPYRLIKNTFTNQIGLISDLAIKIGKKEYNPQNPDLSLKNKCAECTLATGLEIDAAKTGVRPKLTNLKKAASPGKDYFLQREDSIKDYKGIEQLKVTKMTSHGPYGGELYLAERPIYSEKTGKQYRKLIDAEFIPLDALAPNIDRFPGYFLKDLSGEWKAEPDNGADRRPREILLFRFQADDKTRTLDTSWLRKLKNEEGAKEKLDKMSALIKAYGKVASDAGYIRKQKEKASRSYYMNKIWYLLMTIFDISVEGLPATHTEITDAIELVHSDLRSIFETKAEVEEAIDRMKKRDWSFAEPEKREALLYQILGTDKLLDETKEILLCNEPDAFYFLKFYLHEIKNEMILQSSVDEKDLSDRKEAKYLSGYSEKDYKVFLHEYLVGQNNKESKMLWNARIIDLCRKRLAAKDMFNGDIDCALKYYYACRGADPGRRFLWEVFPTNVILRNVLNKLKE
jgi:hypothetical protein